MVLLIYATSQSLTPAGIVSKPIIARASNNCNRTCRDAAQVTALIDEKRVYDGDRALGWLQVGRYQKGGLISWQRVHSTNIVRAIYSLERTCPRSTRTGKGRGVYERLGFRCNLAIVFCWHLIEGLYKYQQRVRVR